MGLLSSILEPLTGSGAAATAASDANFRGMQAEREMFDISRTDQLAERERMRTEGSPWIEGGLKSMGMYDQSSQEGFKFDLASDPVYGERIKELDKLMANSQSAKGMKFSGSTLSKLRDATATEVGSSYGRQFDKYQANLSNLFQGAQVGSNMQQGVWGQTGAQTANMAGQAVQHGSNLAQGFQNQGAIQAQAATAPFQNLLAAGNAAGGAAAAFTAFSDRRLKHSIEHIGMWANGLPIYSFSYLWDDVVHIGFMADEVEKLHPEAVSIVNGYKAVDYSLAVM